MKKNFLTMLAAMLSTVALADSNPVAATTNSAAPVTPVMDAAQPAKPAASPARRPAAKKAPELRSVPLTPGPAVVSANRVNVRGQAKLRSEVIGRMTNGEPVVVIEEILLKNSGPDEPSAWAKIALPAKIQPWVHAAFIDRQNLTVNPRKLNVRAGPGENYSVLGTLERGHQVKEVQTKDGWIQIESESAPGAYAFMASQYLSQEPLALAALNPVAVEATPTPAEVVDQTPVVPTTAEPVTDPEIAAMTTNEPVPVIPEATQATPVIEEPPPPRIVQREGYVRGTISIQAPTRFELISPDNRKPINYLYTTSKELDLSRYKGLHIIVTGEEGLDERWRNTPVITIQRIQVLD